MYDTCARTLREIVVRDDNPAQSGQLDNESSVSDDAQMKTDADNIESIIVAGVFAVGHS